MVEYNTKAALVEAAQMYKSCAISVSGEVAPEARVAVAQAANDLLTIQGVDASFVAVQVGGGAGHYGILGRRRPSDHGGGPAQAHHPGGGAGTHPDRHRPIPCGAEKECAGYGNQKIKSEER